MERTQSPDDAIVRYGHLKIIEFQNRNPEKTVGNPGVAKFKVQKLPLALKRRCSASASAAGPHLCYYLHKHNHREANLADATSYAPLTLKHVPVLVRRSTKGH